MRVLAAMSGGVDSAVAAARAQDAGHEVVGVHLALSRMPGTLRTGSRGCCTIEDSIDARRVAGQLGIPFYVWDFSDRFKADVVDNFLEEYEQGRTPNPCLRCNEKIKFEAVLDRAMALGFDKVVTGHYATVVDTDDGRVELHRSAEWAKDQSYVLGVLTDEQLRHCLFPLGETPSKDQVRAEAEARGFSVASKPDSHDICFIPDGDTQGFLEDKLGAKPGAIVDRDGQVVGDHSGTHGYTIGQRKGLQIGYPAPDGKPRYVLDIRPKTREVVVGPKDALDIVEMSGARVSFAGADPVTSGITAGQYQDGVLEQFDSFDGEVQVRAHGDTYPAQIWMEQGTLHIRVQTPISGLAPGQSAVVYLGTRVVGQCTVDQTVSADDTVSAGASAAAEGSLSSA
jgi:tRNA-specific 2-thiouridylase